MINTIMRITREGDNYKFNKETHDPMDACCAFYGIISDLGNKYKNEWRMPADILKRMQKDNDMVTIDENGLVWFISDYNTPNQKHFFVTPYGIFRASTAHSWFTVASGNEYAEIDTNKLLDPTFNDPFEKISDIVSTVRILEKETDWKKISNLCEWLDDYRHVFHYDIRDKATGITLYSTDRLGGIQEWFDANKEQAKTSFIWDNKNEEEREFLID